MSGPPRKPTAIARAQGTPSHHKRHAEVVVPPGRIVMPKWLADRPYAVEAWKHFAPICTGMGVLTTADVGALAMLCDAFGQYRECRDVIAAEGRTYQRTSARGGTVTATRPEVAIGADAMRRALSLMSQFGLTPSGRAKVPASAPPATDPFAVFEVPQ